MLNEVFAEAPNTLKEPDVPSPRPAVSMHNTIMSSTATYQKVVLVIMCREREQGNHVPMSNPASGFLSLPHFAVFNALFVNHEQVAFYF